jgi:hypothetical protein
MAVGYDLNLMIGAFLRKSFLPFPRSPDDAQAGIQSRMLSECENTSLDLFPKFEIDSDISHLHVLFTLAF